MALQEHVLSEHEKQAYSLALGTALRSLYGSKAYLVAFALARLFHTGGDQKTAESFRRMASIGVERDLIFWRARHILEAPEATHRADRRRDVEVLLAGTRALASSGPFAEGLKLALSARRIADDAHNRCDAYYYAR